MLTEKSVHTPSYRAVLMALKAIQELQLTVEYFDEKDGIIEASNPPGLIYRGGKIRVEIEKQKNSPSLHIKTEPYGLSLVNLGINQRLKSSIQKKYLELNNPEN